MAAAQLVTITSVAAVVISALAIAAGLKGVRDQLRVSVFLTYTDRYTKIMDGIPFEARQPGSTYRLTHRPDDERIQVLSAFRGYFNLCSEEKWLYDHRKIDRPTWNIWMRSMQVVAQFPCFSEAWEALSFEYECSDDFQDFVINTLLPRAVPPREENLINLAVDGTAIAEASDLLVNLSAETPNQQTTHSGRTDASDDYAQRLSVEFTAIGAFSRRAIELTKRAWKKLFEST